MLASFGEWKRRLFGVNSTTDFGLQIAYICFLEPCNDGERSFSTKETVQRKYTPSKQVYKPYTAVETYACAVVPLRTLVAGQIDLTTGGEGATTPMRKLTSDTTGTCA